MNAKPFIKWVGGKGQLIEQLDALLPADFDDWDNVTYIEPFVGGGAMLFYMLQRYPNIKRAVINDINPDLTTCYKTVRDFPEDLIVSLREISRQYLSLSSENEKKAFYMEVRNFYNKKNHDPIKNTTFFFFLNRTCFNGLYRVNKAGKYNVPFGRYANPLLCDEQTIRADSKVLKHVDIMTADFEQTFDCRGERTLFYFDPPYRPLSGTSSFNDYTKESFNDAAQIRLKEFCDRVHHSGCTFMLSNSDCKGKNVADNFFDVLYSDYSIERVWASRNVNANGSKRGRLTEILVHNYRNTRKNIVVNNDAVFAAENELIYGQGL